MVFRWCFICFYSRLKMLQDCTFSANLPLDVPWLQLHCEPANVAGCNHGMLNTLERPQLEAAGNARVMFSTSRTEYQGRRQDATKRGLLSFLSSCQSRLIVNFYLLIVSYSQITYYISALLILSDLILYTTSYLNTFYFLDRIFPVG